MEIEKRYQLEKAVDQQREKETIRYIHISENRATACNGHILATVPCVTVKGDHLGPITVESLLYARDNAVTDIATLHLIDGKTAIAVDSAQLPRSLESSAWAKEEQLDMLRKSTDDIPPIDEITEAVIPKQNFGDVLLCINPKMLLDLAKALGSSEKLVLRMKPDDETHAVEGAIRVEADKDAYGVIMPMKLHDDETREKATASFEAFSFENDATVTMTGSDGTEAVLGVAESHITEAIAIIKETRRGSTSSIQRRMKIGYTLAAKIMDILEERGIVGPAKGSDPREVLIEA